MDLQLAKREIDEGLEVYKDVNNEPLGICFCNIRCEKGSWGMYHNNVMYILWCFEPNYIIHLINHEFMHGILDIIDGVDTCCKYHAINESLESWVET
jgi:hypothetical protein